MGPPPESSPPPAGSPPPPGTNDAPPPAPEASPSGNQAPPPPPPPPAGSNSPPPSTSPSPPPPKSGSPSSSPPTPPPPPPSGMLSPPPPPDKATPTPGSSNPVPPAFVPVKQTPPSRGVPASSASPGGSPPSSDSSSSNNIAIIAGVAVVGAVVIAFVFVWLLCSKKKKKQPYYMDPGHPAKDAFHNGSTRWNSTNRPDYVVKVPPPPGLMGGPGGSWGAPPMPLQANTSSEFGSDHNHAAKPPLSPGLGGFNKSQFSYEELAAATGGFSQANLLGQGGFGYVHKGVLPDGREVAVKSLKSGSGQGEREFQAEVEIISRVHHRHLVSLVGYCIADGQRMLVYEFVPNKTLEFHLHGKGQLVMDWGNRLRIALGSAKGLAYLHEDCYPKIIHRDIKAANILLDDKFEAMVADFGLAKLSSDNYTHVSTRVMGTFGYLAPEYASSGKLTEKSDVFSFGVMLLELITGRRPVDLTNKFMEDSLVDWARPLLAKAMEDGNYNDLVDPRLEGNYVSHEMARMISCAAASIRHSARRRPKMSQIVRALEGDSSLEDLNEGTKQNRNGPVSSQGGSVETQAYDTGMYNADMNKFRKMIMNSQEYNSSDFGATSEYGLNPSSSSSDSRESGTSDHQKPKL